MSNQQNQPEVVLEARNITKRFPGVLANDQVDIQLRRGEILALLGENGAGKSTLMNIIYGLYHADEGQIFLKGQDVRFASPREAIHSGIGMVHQHFQLVDVMTVAENVVLGEERETPSWHNLFSLLFLTIFGAIAAFLFMRNNNPLAYTGVVLALVGVLMPWIGVKWFVNKVFNIATSTFNLEILPQQRTLVRQILTGITSAIIIVAMIYNLDNPGSETLLALISTGIFVGLGYAIPLIFLRNPAERFRDRIARFYSGDIASPVFIYLTLLAVAIIGLVILGPLWLGYQTTDSKDVDKTLEFLFALLLALAGTATIALRLSALPAFIFQYWERISAGLRVGWGLLWRLGLIGAVVWLGGLAETITEMGIITNILQTELPFEYEGDNAGASGSRDYEVRWNRINREGDYEAQIAALLEEIDDDYYREETERFTQNGVVFQSHVEGYYGKNTAMLREVVDDVPQQVRVIVISVLVILVSMIAISSWRGSRQIPGNLSPYSPQDGILSPKSLLSELVTDIDFMVGMAAVYAYTIWSYSQELDQTWQIILTAIGVVAMALIFIWTAYQRWKDPDRIRPINPLDTAIDALTDIIYTVGTIRNTRHAAERVRELSRQYGLEVDPDAIIEKLPVGLQQRVEIIKALYRRADILILDEPTAVLTPQEGQELFKIMRELSQQGVSIIFITHKLKEVFEVATNIVVMRNGAVVGTTTPAEATRESLAAMMVGREVLLLVDKDEAQPAETVLRVDNLQAYDDRGAMALNNVSFDVRAGEVLGVAGVQGNGQSELVEVLTGLRSMSEGAVDLLGQQLKPKRHPDAMPLQRLWAVVLDLAVVLGLAAFVSYFWSYFDGTVDNFKLISVQSILIFMVLDAIYTLGSWQLWGATFGKAITSLQIVNREDDSHPSFPALMLRYICQTAMRYSIVGYPLAAALKANNDPALAEMPFEKRFSGALNEAWYDELPLINCRVANRIAITSRRIKDLGASHVPEDRHRFGMVKPFTVAENLILNDYYKAPHAQAPSQIQLPFVSATYALLFGSIFAILGYLWLYIWNLSLWEGLLDQYGVPKSGELRAIPTGRISMSDIQRNYLNDPLVASLLILLIMTLVVAVISYLLTKGLIRLMKKPTGIMPPLVWMGAVYLLLGLGSIVFKGMAPGLYDTLTTSIFNIMTSTLRDFEIGLADSATQGLIAALILIFVVIVGNIYNLLSQMAESDQDFVQMRTRLQNSRVGQFIEVYNEHGLGLNLTNSVDYSQDLIEEYDIRTPSPLVTGGSLSGGNQQKLVVAREFSRKPRLLIASQPTRGIDVGSIEFIHKQIISQRDKGAAVLLVSAELDEIMSLSDRIAVMYKGAIIKVVAAESATREELGLLMAGIEHN